MTNETTTTVHLPELDAVAVVTVGKRYTGARDYFTAPRMYVWPEGESILDNLQNRRQRPYTTWKKMLVPQVLAALHLDGCKVRWSQHAGCTMCPCSPGFILDGGWVTLDGLRCDIHISLMSTSDWEAKQHPADPNEAWLAAGVS